MNERSLLDELRDAASVELISPLEKGLGPLAQALPVERAPELGWNLLAEDIALPCAVLYESRMAHNLRWMQEFMRAYSLKLAPHGKTTMAPALFKRQLDAGAWGITVATAQQALVAAAHGTRRVLLANQLVGKRNCELALEVQRGVELYCLVDSVASVTALGRFFGQRSACADVLLEIGPMGGRTGVRNDAELEAVLAALQEQRGAVRLCGVELYEGVLEQEQAIVELLQRAVRVTRELSAAGRFERRPAILSGAGSAWYDVVAEELTRARFGEDVEVVLRPGCYLSHDAGLYREQQARILARNPVARAMQSGLLPALEVWAYVNSVPEPGLAIVGLGKRDVAFDAGLPQPVRHFRPGQATPSEPPRHWRTERLMDQHAFVRVAEGDDLAVGDLLAFGISHPCLTFDKWRQILVLSDDYRVLDVVKTYF